MEFLGSHNISDTIACKIEVHELRRHPGKGVHVRQIPNGVAERLFSLVQKEGPSGQKARLELIQRSIVNADGTPLFPSEESVQALTEGNQPIFLDFIDAIAAANNKKPAEINKEADDLEKN